MSSTIEVTAAAGSYRHATVSRSRQLARWLPPLLLQALSHLLFWYAARRHGFDWLKLDTHFRWDSGQYAWIARDGYKLAQCPEYIVPPSNVCGNQGWFPLYSWTLRPFHSLGLSWNAAGMLVAELSFAGTLLILWHLLGARVTLRNLACVALVLGWPGAVYFHAIFPMSLSVFLASATWWLLTRQRWLLAALAGLLTAMTYSIAALIAPAALVYLFLTRRRGSWSWLSRGIVVGGAAALGVVFVFFVIWRDTGLPTGYIDRQVLSTKGTHNPLRTGWALMQGRIGSLWPGTGPHPWPLSKVARALAWEERITLALLLVALALVTVAVIRRTATPLDIALALYGSLMFLVPLAMGATITQTRSHALMVPMVLVFRRLPAIVSGLLAVALVPLAYALGVLFVTRSMV